MKLTSQNWELIAAYLAVYRTGSLSAAARALGLSQPTLRRQIETLEMIVGTTLFTRSMTGLIPMPGHEALLKEAEAMEAAASSFSRLTAASTGDPQGRVRISAPHVFAVEILPPVLAALRLEWPQLEFELSVTNTVEDLLRRDADVAVRLVQPAQGALVTRKIAPVLLGFYAAPGPVADAARGMDYAALRDSGLMIGQDRERSMELVMTRLNFEPPLRYALRTDDDLAQLAAIRHGVGVGICQTRLAKASDLVPICPELKLELPAWIVAHEDQINIPRIRVVFDALVKALTKP